MNAFNTLCNWIPSTLPRPWVATLIMTCIFSPHAKAASEKTSRVVLVHGIFQSGRSFTPIVRMLEAQGCECLVAKLKPADARKGIGPLAAQLKTVIDQRWGETESIHIIAHSMGGLISREYLQNLGGYKRCKSLTTFASPHHGSILAWCYPGAGAREMRPGSEFLANLQGTEDRLCGIEVLSYCTPMDLIVIPYTSSRWRMAENRTVYAPIHPLVMFTPQAIRYILELTRPTKAQMQ